MATTVDRGPVSAAESEQRTLDQIEVRLLLLLSFAVQMHLPHLPILLSSSCWQPGMPRACYGLNVNKVN